MFLRTLDESNACRGYAAGCTWVSYSGNPDDGNSGEEYLERIGSRCPAVESLSVHMLPVDMKFTGTCLII